MTAMLKTVNSKNAPSEIWPIIIAWGRGAQPSDDERQAIIAWELNNPRGAQLWHLSANSRTLKSNAQIAQALAGRAALLQRVVQGIETHLETYSLPLAGPWTAWIVPLWTFWLPLAQQLDQQQRALKAPFIQGILGGQGTGKTTLTRILNLILGHLGQQSVGLSIDDLYLTYAQRRVLKKQDPRFIWRGPPGTHDIELGIRTLAQLKCAEPAGTFELPQFDKSLHGGQGDRTTPLSIAAPTIVLFEGWFVGTQPVAETVFTVGSPLPEPIVSAADRDFAAECNRKLHDYLPLWNQLDSLLVLAPTDYRRSQQWRQQAEQDMKA
ncbi:MAG: glycerate kinase, partial [Cyanobacteria bacterium J06598_3]